jgi:hypothetical protein
LLDPDITWRVFKCWHRRKIRLVECNAKCRYPKYWPVKGLSGRCFICLRPSPLLWPHTPPPYTLYVYTVYLLYLHRVGGRRANRREG